MTWKDITIHVVALRIDPDNAALNEGLASIRSGRANRAQLIG